MAYAIVIVLSVTFTFLGFATECATRNIVHVKHGREPNAGASIFPTIPFIPAMAVGFTWFLNGFYPNLGFWVIVVLFVLYVPYWWWNLRRLDAKLQSLFAASERRGERQHRVVGTRCDQRRPSRIDVGCTRTGVIPRRRAI